MKTLSTMLIVLTLAQCASAITIDFEDEVSQCNGNNNYSGSEYSTDGFSFDVAPGFKIFGSCYSGGISNGTDIGGWVDEFTSPSIGDPVTIHYGMTLDSVAPFSIQYVDLGQSSFDPTAGTVRVSGSYSGGGGPTQLEFATPRGSFATYTFPSEWEGLTQVTFRQLTDNVVLNSIDNVVLNENFTIPEPSTLTLATFALLGLACGRRKRL